MEFKKDDSCSIQKSSFKVSLVFFYLSLTRGIDYSNETSIPLSKLLDKSIKMFLDNLENNKK